MRLMYDSTDPYAIPASARIVAGYVDGSLYRWPEKAWDRFPHAVKVRIARRTYTNDGHVLDVEYGIPTVWPINGSIVDWVRMRRKAGIEPTIYCNQLYDWGPLRNLFARAGVREPQWWVARYDNVREIPAGAVAKQFANPPLAGGHYDLSVVRDTWPGVDARKGVFMAGLTDAEQRELLNKTRYIYSVLDSPEEWSVQHWNLGEVLSAMRTADIGYAQPETLHAKTDAVRKALEDLKTYVEGLQ